jgi:hypothetical protein
MQLVCIITSSYHMMSQWVRQIVICLQVLSGYIIYQKFHSPCVGLLVRVLEWSDQPCNSGCQDKLSIPCMYTWWLNSNRDKLSEWLLVRTEWLKTCQSANDWGVPAFGMLGQNWGYHLAICPWGVENTLK